MRVEHCDHGYFSSDFSKHFGAGLRGFFAGFGSKVSVLGIWEMGEGVTGIGWIWLEKVGKRAATTMRMEA
jgi:hypothetical protein